MCRFGVNFSLFNILREKTNNQFGKHLAMVLPVMDVISYRKLDGVALLITDPPPMNLHK